MEKNKASEIKECIICRKGVVDFSDEHVIPQSLGGYYHIYTVCKKCNSDLGSYVDSKLVNHKLSELYRFVKDVKGKDGKIPNPFSGTHRFTNDSKKKVRLQIDSKKNIQPYVVPDVIVEKSKDGVESVTVTLDAKDEIKLDKIVRKVTRRKKISYEGIAQGKKKKQFLLSPEVHVSVLVDLHDFKLGLLKIAYEFAVDSIPNYYNDPMAEQISKVLEKADHNRSAEFVKIGDGFQNEILEPFEELLDFSSEKHYLILFSTNERLICFIKLYMTFAVGVVLSNDKIIDRNLVVGVNDLKQKSFKKYFNLDLIDEIYSPSELRFQYKFENEKMANYFRNLEQSPDFGFYMENGEIPLFKKGGDVIEKNLNHLIFESKSEYFLEESNGFHASPVIEFDEELYIKILPTNELFCIVAVKEEREQLRKL